MCRLLDDIRLIELLFNIALKNNRVFAHYSIDKRARADELTSRLLDFTLTFGVGSSAFVLYFFFGNRAKTAPDFEVCYVSCCQLPFIHSMTAFVAIRVAHG